MPDENAANWIPSWVPDEHRPNERQIENWKQYLITEDGSDAVGWWIGWCPIHDPERDPEHATAEFNFQKDSYRCTAEPQCHSPKKGMSLTNLKARLAAQEQTDG